MARVLAIHAHPDDLETLAAGTLALLVAAGHEVIIATLTAGDCGSVSLSREETARVRRSEATRAAAIIGAPYHCLGLPDLGVFIDDATRRHVTEFIRQKRPDIIVTAAPADYHPDHEATSALVRDGGFAASVPNYQTGRSAPLSAPPHLYFTDPIGGRAPDGQRIIPDFAVDIGTTFEVKREMLAAHESQTAWLAHQHRLDDPVAAMASLSRRRGEEYCATYAEGFRHYRGEPFPRTPWLQELLGPAVLAARPV
ncbi:MAG TPA: PIG-L family deacetylase [Caulobacteraceae bacterium]|jgi:LmbE family N-acetylglucosaminyl deacetylase|nr:PIG-L family deacetylase [Caulobacteraceae bacterium]